MFVCLYGMSTTSIHRAELSLFMHSGKNLKSWRITLTPRTVGALTHFLSAVYFLCLIVKLQQSGEYTSHNKHTGLFTVSGKMHLKMFSFAFHMALTQVETGDLCSVFVSGAGGVGRGGTMNDWNQILLHPVMYLTAFHREIKQPKQNSMEPLWTLIIRSGGK